MRARFGIFLLVLIATVVAAAVVSLAMPKTYKATASLLVVAKDEQSLSNVLQPLMLPQERLSYLQTQKDIIGSKKVARKVVQDLKLAEKASAVATLADDEASRSSHEDRLVEGLLKNLKVETSQSNVMELSFSSPDPHYSMQVANGFAKAYIDTMLEFRVEPAREAAAWFDEQLKGLRANLEDAQVKLTDNHQRQQIVSADERLDFENSRLAALSDEVRIIVSTPAARQASMTCCVPVTLVNVASNGLYSPDSTCLSAAQWKTTSMPSHARTSRSRSRMSPIRNRTSRPRCRWRW